MDGEGKPWTSTAASYQQKDLGYTYPDLQIWLDKYKTNGSFDKAKYQKALREDVGLKYPTTDKSTLQLPGNAMIADVHMAAMAMENLAVEYFPPTLIQKAEEIQAEHPKPFASPEESWYANDYVVNVVYDR